MKTYTVISYGKGGNNQEHLAYMQKKRAIKLAELLKLNQLVERVDIITKEYSGYEMTSETINHYYIR